jgi:fructan beta-fructosidase
VSQPQGKSADVLGSRQPGNEALELVLNIDAAEAGLITLGMSNELGQQVQFRVNRRLQRYELDRSKSGDVGFNPDFAHDQYAALKTMGRALSLHIFIDRASIEIFADEGRTAVTAIAFPSVPFNTVTLSADQAIEVNSGMAYRLRSIWSDHKPAQ